jgi:hypothetical protein
MGHRALPSPEKRVRIMMRPTALANCSRDGICRDSGTLWVSIRLRLDPVRYARELLQSHRQVLITFSNALPSLP